MTTPKTLTDESGREYRVVDRMGALTGFKCDPQAECEPGDLIVRAVHQPDAVDRLVDHWMVGLLPLNGVATMDRDILVQEVRALIRESGGRL
jgi:hypothetical protein